MIRIPGKGWIIISKQVGWGFYPNKNKLRKRFWVDTSPLPSPQGEGKFLK